METTTLIEIAEPYKNLEAEIQESLRNFDQFGDIIQQERNTIRKGKISNLDVTIKSFKKPSWIQGIIYGSFRLSKAKRSYLYSKILTQKGIGTAEPVAFVEIKEGKRLTESFFISSFIPHDFTIREVLNNKVPDKPRIMQQFVEFTLRLHENGVQHLDHSPGNTLIKKEGDDYHFSIIDINRMRFTQLNLKQRLNNFVRLAAPDADRDSFAKIYAGLVGESPQYCVETLATLSRKRQGKVDTKKRLKRLLKGKTQKHAK